MLPKHHESKKQPSVSPQKETSIAIIGAGFAGLGMGIRLKEENIEDFLIFERASDVGGVWRDNSYPGCACDVESNLYSFSFAPNPHWSRVFSTQPEIWQYLRNCAHRTHLEPHLRFNHNFESAHWDQAQQKWRIQTSQGVYWARVLISAMGAFSEPLIPRFKGLDGFQGRSFHSAQWDHSFDFKGKKVVVIGTGASAIQFIPEIQPLVDQLVVFQRTPAWVLPRLDRPLNEKEIKRYEKFPFLQKLSRLRIYILRELYGLTFRVPRWIGFATGMALHHMKKAIKDPVLRAKLTPEYTIGCKRILLSNNYFPALAQKNVEVITDSIREIKDHSVVAADGREFEAEALVFGTGFHVTDFPLAQKVFGKSGANLDEVWTGSPRAYLGTTIPDFPNFFMLLGPNTGLGHNSVVLMIEAQIEHTLKAIQFLRKKKLSALEPKLEKEKKFIRKVDEFSRKTVWLSGCRSWYLDKHGRNSSLWPLGVGAFRRRTRPFHPRDYLVTGTFPERTAT